MLSQLCLAPKNFNKYVILFQVLKKSKKKKVWFLLGEKKFFLKKKKFLILNPEINYSDVFQETAFEPFESYNLQST